MEAVKLALDAFKVSPSVDGGCVVLVECVLEPAGTEGVDLPCCNLPVELEWDVVELLDMFEDDGAYNV
jgi:hypothetical protein